MNNIMGIIDMDGFTIERKFYCKELGMIKRGDDEGKTYLFDIGLCWETLTVKDRKNCMFLTRHIHKLPFNTTRGSFPLSRLNDIVKDFYNNIKDNKESRIAYKGGHIERDLLKELKIPATNLEDFGCPKAEMLFDELVWLETCGHHLGTHAYHHCPKVEVEAFAAWMKEKN